MELIKKLKETLGLEKLDSPEGRKILSEIKAEIEAEEVLNKMSENEKEQHEAKEWAERVAIARASNHRINRRRQNQIKNSRINPHRQNTLRKADR